MSDDKTKSDNVIVNEMLRHANKMNIKLFAVTFKEKAKRKNGTTFEVPMLNYVWDIKYCARCIVLVYA